MEPRPEPDAPAPRVPVITCPRCAWAKGALSVLDTPMLARAHLHRALQTHLRDAHGVELSSEPPSVDPAPAVPGPAALQAG